MTDRELLQQALDALESWQKTCLDCGRSSEELGRATKSLQAIRARLAQPEPKPVAWLCWEDKENNLLADTVLSDKACTECFPVYTAPPKKEWVGLTDKEVKQLSDYCVDVRDEIEFIRAIEEEIKEKNNG